MAQGYRMRLYDQEKAVDVTVDPIFPFDVNLYPLVGFVEQYLWPSVLFKCLAKLKDGYRHINEISFIELYSTLTNKKLLRFEVDEE